MIKLNVWLKKDGKTRVAAVSALALALVMAGGIVAWAADTDGDSMSDDYELLFGLNPANPADAGLDYDADLLSNLAEYGLLTDPLAMDTDADLWPDGMDAAPLSRVNLRWGETLFCYSNQFLYTGPSWWLGASKSDGAWQTNPPAWHVPAGDPENTGWLFIDLDRSALTTDVRLAATVYDHTNASLYLDLLDTNAAFVATNLFGNLLAGSDQAAELWMTIPLETFNNAAVIDLRRGAGEITVYHTAVFVDRDEDGLDADQEAQLGLSDEVNEGGGLPAAGLQVWVRADAGVTATNGCVLIWADQSGHGNNFVQSVTTNSSPQVAEDVLNGNPVMRFDGVNDYLTNAFTPTGQVTVVLLRRYQALDNVKQSLFNCHKTTSPDGGFYLGAGGNSSPYDRQALFTACGGTWFSGAGSQDVGALTTNWAVDTLRISATNTALWTDDVLITNAASGSIAAGRGLVLGINGAAMGSYPFEGDVAEILVYDRALSETELTLAANYLGAKYNRPPLVSAGPDRTLTLPVAAALSGTVSDDGYPVGGSTTASWSVVSGPGSVAFADSNAPATTASFSTAGVYVLRLTASDSALSADDETTVTVNEEELGGSLPAAGLRLWVKADAGILTNSGGVYQWGDQSGNGNHFWSSGTLKPQWQANWVNGRPVMKFDGTNDYLTNACVPAGQLTVFMARRYRAFTGAKQSLFNCHKTTSPDGGFYLGVGGNSSPYNRQALFTACGGTWFSGAGSQDLGLLTTNWAVDTLLISATNTALWTDGVLKTNAASGSIAAGRGLVLGANADALGALPFRGEVAELLVYTNALSESDRSAAQTYLYNKYQNPDADGDELSDAWELGYWGNLGHGAAEDADDDGLTNLQEYQLGTNPTLADTDGDGLGDYNEVFVYFTNPALADSDSDGTNDLATVATLAGTNTVWRMGTWLDVGMPGQPLDQVFAEDPAWTSDGTTLVATNIGRVEYEFTVPRGGIYHFSIRHINRGQTPPAGYQYRLLFLANHVRAATWNVDVAGNATWDTLETPWLPAGTNNLRLVWINQVAGGSALGLEQVQLDSITGGADTNANGIQDWQDALLPAGQDTDEDGLSDLSEITSYETDPTNPDSDGDSLRDGEELDLFGTDPRTANTYGAPDTVLLSEQDGTNYIARTPSSTWKHDWYEVDSSMMIKWHEGTLTYALTVPTGSMYRLAAQLRGFRSEMPDDYKYQIDVEMDGHYLETLEVFADMDFSGVGCLNTPWMIPGEHTVRFTWLNATYIYDPSLRDPNLLFEKVRLLQVNGPDTNANGRADWMDALLDENKDSDGDGLTDLQELDSYGTDPLNADTDHDGLTDGQEIALGTDPNDADSDDDGVPDGVEVEAGTDPLSADFDGTYEDVCVVMGSATNSAKGTWQTNAASLYAVSPRGEVTYTLTNSAADIYALVVAVRRAEDDDKQSPFELVASLDGELAGRRIVYAGHGSNVLAFFFTPNLTANASHTVTLLWDSAPSGRHVQVDWLALRRLGGPDANTNGVKDWIESLLYSGTSWDAPSSSLISPACLEGHGRFLDLMSVSGAAAIKHGVKPSATAGLSAQAWFADVPLSEAGPTNVVVTWENGLRAMTSSIAWTPLNVLSNQDQTIRKGDALRLVAAPAGATSGVSKIQIVGGPAYTNAYDTPVACAFTNAGTNTIVGTYLDGGTSNSETILVYVRQAAFPTNAPLGWVGKSRTWTCTNVPAAGVTVCAETNLALSTATVSGKQRLTFTADRNDPRWIVARAGATNGPILANSEVWGFRFHDTAEEQVYVSEIYADGSINVWETVTISRPRPGLRMQLAIFIAGVVFDDGTTVRNVYPADFDEIDQYTFHCIRPSGVWASVCHITYLYQDNVMVGTYFDEDMGVW